MKRLAGGAAVLGLVLCAYLLGRQHTPADDEVEGTVESEPDPDSATTTVVPEPPKTVEDRPPDGLVVGPGDRPVAGAVVRVAGAHFHPQEEITADDLGRFWLPRAISGVVDVWATGPKLSAPVTEGIRFGGKDAKKVRIRLAHAPNYRGVVSEVGTGKRVGGALVRLLSTWPGVVRREARAALDGSFDLGPVTPGEYSILVEAHGYRSIRGEAVAVSGVDALFELSAGASVDVQVRDERGTPVAGAKISVAGGTGKTDAQGRVLIRGLPTGKHRAAASHPTGGRGRSPTLRLKDGVAVEAIIVLRPGKKVRGRVLDEGGAPIAGARVRQESDGGLVVATDDQGRFELMVDGDSVDLVVSKDGYLRTVTLTTVGTGRTLDVTLTRPYRPIEGWVLSPAGGELGGAHVKLIAKGGTAAARSGRNGRFEFHPGFAGPYRVRATHAEYAASPEGVVDVNGQVTVSVLEPAELYFDVVGADSIDPIAAASVDLSGPERRRGQSSRDGAVRFTLLPPGAYTVQVTAPWRRPLRRRVEAVAGPANEAMRLALDPAGELQLTIQAADTAENLEGAWVKAGGVETTASRGAALLKGLPVGDVTLSVGAKGFRTWRRTVPVLFGETGREEVFLDRER